MKYTKIIIIALLLLAINSCKEDDKNILETEETTEENDKSPREYSPETIQEEYGSARVVGFVKDKAGNPLDGVRVHFGEHESITDGEGKFELSEVSAGSGKRIWFEKEGYARTQKLVEAREDLPNRVDAALFQIAKSEKISDEGGLIEGDDFSFDIQSGGFVYSDGEIVEGEVIVSVTPFLTSEEYFIDAFPGDFEGTREDGSNTPIESFGFIDVDLRDEAGEPVQMADGVTATLKIKAPENAPATIPMWWYNYKKAEWIEEGTGSLDNGFYSAVVTHFTPWNWDLPIEPSFRVSGYVKDQNGLPIKGVSINQIGINRAWANRTTTNVSGYFSALSLEAAEFRLEVSYSFYPSKRILFNTNNSSNVGKSLDTITLELNLSEIIDPEISVDTILVTNSKNNYLYGNYFGVRDFKDKDFYKRNKIIIDEIECKILSWRNDKIFFEVPEIINSEGHLELIRENKSMKLIPYINGDWTCKVGISEYDITDNRLSENAKDMYELPDCIGNLQGLKSIHASVNKLNSLPESIAKLDNLETLAITFNSFTELPLQITQLKSLSTLYIHDNYLSEIPSFISECKSLKSAVFSRNRIRKIDNSVGELDNLTGLYVSNNRLTELGEGVSKLNNLRFLEAHFNNINTISDSFCELTSLISISIYNNNIASLPEEFGNLINLEELDIRFNNLSSLPESIKNLRDNLKDLFLEGNPISEEEKAKIESWLPNTQIEW